MAHTPDLLRMALIFCVVGIALMAAISLRKRSLSFSTYLGWGLLIILVPLVGPFLALLIRPGHPNPRDRRNSKRASPALKS